jgi:hypothetical protein
LAYIKQQWTIRDFKIRCVHRFLIIVDILKAKNGILHQMLAASSVLGI